MKECQDCHVLTPLSEYAKDKRTKDGHGCYCRKCVRIRSAAHYQKNKEKVKAQHREWVKNNPGKMTEYSKRWVQANPEKAALAVKTWQSKNKESIALSDKTRRENNIEKYLERERLGYVKHKAARTQRLKNWHARNPHMVTAYAAGRRAAKKQRTMKWLTESQIKDMEFMYVLSDLLTKTTGVQHHVDHIVPLRSKYVSGLHVPWNLQVLPAIDNLKKNNHFVPGSQHDHHKQA